MPLLGAEHQRLADLHLCLYRRSFHPELFQIYAAEDYRGPAYSMSAWIIGCSHVVTFVAGDATLTELTTSDCEPLGERFLLQRRLVRGERTCQQRIAAGRINYVASFQVEAVSDHLFRQTTAEMVREGQRRGLLVQFEQWKARRLTPFAYVNCDICAAELRVQAFHGFAEEGILVKTQSIFELG